MIDKNAIRNNLEHILERIERSAAGVGRRASDITLVVVSKGQPAEVIQQACLAGISVFGENYPEETLEKSHKLTPGSAVEWHMIGHLQSRKVRIVCSHFSMLHSLDSLKLAYKLNEELSGLNKKLPCLLEVNVSGEESKYGFSASDEGRWSDLLPEFDKVVGLPNIQVRGLMTMPPLYNDPEGVRPYFVRVRKLQDYLTHHIPQIQWEGLSMGTSGDFEVAVQEGATYVRIGTAILGQRPTLKSNIGI